MNYSLSSSQITIFVTPLAHTKLETCLYSSNDHNLMLLSVEQVTKYAESIEKQQSQTHFLWPINLASKLKKLFEVVSVFLLHILTSLSAEHVASILFI